MILKRIAVVVSIALGAPLVVSAIVPATLDQPCPQVVNHRSMRVERPQIINNHAAARQLPEGARSTRTPQTPTQTQTAPAPTRELGRVQKPWVHQP